MYTFTGARYQNGIESMEEAKDIDFYDYVWIYGEKEK